MGRRAGGKDFAPRVRSGVDRVLEKWQDAGKLDKAIEDALEEDFVGTIKALATYAPKQVDMSMDQTVSIDATQLTAETLREAFAIKAERDAERTEPVH